MVLLGKTISDRNCQDKENKLYVMKIIDMSRMDTKQRKDAINEVRVLSSLKHPYIVLGAEKGKLDNLGTNFCSSNR